MRKESTLLLTCAVLALFVAGARAQTLAVYQGPPEKKMAVRLAYLQLLRECPRLVLAMDDIADYGLRVGVPSGTGVLDNGARQLNADIMIMVSFRLIDKPVAMPASLVPPLHAFAIGMLAAAGEGAITVNDPLGSWMCGVNVDAGHLMGMKESPELARLLAK